MAIVVTMCKLWLSMLVGFVANKRGMLQKETSQKVSSLIIRVTSPLLIIGSVSGVGEGDQTEVLMALVIGICVYGGFSIIAVIIMRFWRVAPDRKGVYQLMMIFANCSFMGIPVCQSLLGDRGMFLEIIMNLPYNLLFFTYGVFLIMQDRGGNTKIRVRDILTPGTIASILALVIYFTGAQLPRVLNEPINFVGNLTPALSMICIGSSMADYSMREIFKNKELYVISALRLVILPALGFLILSHSIDNLLLTRVATFSMAMPVGAMVAMGTSEYGGNTEVASSGVALSTIFSMATIPLIAVLMGI